MSNRRKKEWVPIVNDMVIKRWVRYVCVCVCVCKHETKNMGKEQSASMLLMFFVSIGENR